MHVLCKKTFYSKLEQLKKFDGQVKFDQGLFRYNFEVSIYVIANKDFKLTSDEFHEDFGSDDFLISTGDVLAWSYPSTYSAEKSVYASMKCIFSFSESDEVENGSYFLNCDDNYVSITAIQSI